MDVLFQFQSPPALHLSNPQQVILQPLINWIQTITVYHNVNSRKTSVDIWIHGRQVWDRDSNELWLDVQSSSTFMGEC